MKDKITKNNPAQNLIERIANHDFPPYVYTYPPTRTYQPIEQFNIENVILTPDVNIYLHIPFCKQKCTFCGYLTTIDGSGDFQKSYVDTIIAEIEMKQKLFEHKTITSTNFGGGTPSLLTIDQFEKIFNKLVQINPNIIHTATEIGIEATPESVEYEKLNHWKQLGLNRLSIGIQTFNNQEISLSKRHNWAQTSIDAIETARKSKIPNICCDLMYGIEGQTITSWKKSVNGVLEYKPDTIELYALAMQPKTPLAKKVTTIMSNIMNNQNKYTCYEIARTLLLESDYMHDSHLRFIIPNRGFYAQQVNASQGQSLIGFGAGARTYAKNVHYRNSFSTTNHKNAIKRYMQNIEKRHHSIETAIFLNNDEQMRRYVIGKLDTLDTDEFKNTFNTEFNKVFPELYSILIETGLAEYNKNNQSNNRDIFKLTPNGLKYRDLIANAFFSEITTQLEQSYWSEIHDR